MIYHYYVGQFLQFHAKLPAKMPDLYTGNKELIQKFMLQIFAPNLEGSNEKTC